jgi:hypothetical protein
LPAERNAKEQTHEQDGTETGNEGGDEGENDTGNEEEERERKRQEGEGGEQRGDGERKGEREGEVERMDMSALIPPCDEGLLEGLGEWQRKFELMLREIEERVKMIQAGMMNVESARDWLKSLKPIYGKMV